MNKPFNPDIGDVVPVAQDPFAYFSPLLTIGHLVVPLGTDLDNEGITRAVVAKEEDRRSEEVGDTKSEDSILPTDKEGPQRSKPLLMGLIGGMLLGAGLSVLRQVLDRRVRYEETVENGLGLRVLCVVPDLSGKPGFQKKQGVA